MPPRAKITRDMILDAAFALVREHGHGALTARRLATALGCSTQPILYQFDGIAQIADAVYRRADALHTARLTDGLDQEPEPLLALGLRYIRFGAEEKHLFRFLFQSGRFDGITPEELTAADGTGPLIAVVAASSGLDGETARGIFQALSVTAHGYASLLANNAMPWDPAAAAATLTAVYEGLIRQVGEAK